MTLALQQAMPEQQVRLLTHAMDLGCQHLPTHL